MLDIKNELNESQCAAVEFCNGASLVIAGAGSGKTRVLTYKIAYLLEQGYKPWNILALTFTNKAAREMKERIGRLVGTEQAKYLHMGTFHSVFSHILRREAQYIGFQSNFTIYDDADQKSLIKQVVKDMGLDDKVYKPSAINSRISMAKNHLIMPQQYAAMAEYKERDRRNNMPQLHAIYANYQQRLRAANAMDFDDLLVFTYVLFRDHEDVKAKYEDQFQYVLVDEYQDTNFVQQEIVKQLTLKKQRVCVVGDDAQSIYSFRGAKIENILNFTSLYNDAKLFKLERNYRSTQRIVEAANSLITKNSQQIRKEVFSKNAEGEALQYYDATSDREEASIVVKQIQRLKRQEQLEYKDFAILYRTNAQSRTFEDEMRRQQIPYRIYGGLSFYQRKEIKDIIAYFRLVVNMHDEEAFRRVLNYPKRGIGNTTLQKISDIASAAGVAPWIVATQPGVFGTGLSAAAQGKVSSFCQMIEGFRSKLETVDAYELGKEIIKESGVSAEIYSSHEVEDIARQENVDEFLGAMLDFVDSAREEGNEHVFLPDFLQQVALATDADKDKEDDDRVTMMTIHSAKGLEFPVVFVVGVEENIFPSPMAEGSLRALEEERRLFYVAITRAERHCIVTSARNRYRFGRAEIDTPSRFLRDIDQRFISFCQERSSSSHSMFGRDEGLYGAGGSYGSDYERQSRTAWQNAHPVASQFKADPVRKVTAAGQNFKRVSQVLRPTSAATSSAPQPTGQHSSDSLLKEGSTIEHQRFGIGTVLSVEGSGENAKATVEFRNSGTKQLLLKFAKYKIIS